MQPLLSYGLLQSKNKLTWSDEFEEAFQAVKESLVSAHVLSYFVPSKPTHLCTDVSQHGLDFVLQQQHSDTWYDVQAGFRFLSDAESSCTIIELELLAVSWAIKKCHLFGAGLPHFTVHTDHHPVIPILNNHRLDEIENRRLQRLKTKIMGYNFTAEWLKGIINNAPNALSRNLLAEKELTPSRQPPQSR